MSVILFFNEAVYDECCENLRRTHENIMKVACMFDLSVQDEIRRDPFGIHDQGNESRNGFVHQTVALVESSVS